MARRAWVTAAIAACLLAGCDVSPPKPETGTSVSAPPPALDTGPGAGERSIRLFGRGVSRQRQTRV